VRRNVALLVAVAVAVIVGSVVWMTSSGSSASTKPLSTLGELRPAPYPGDLGPELVPIPDAPPIAPAGSEATPGQPVEGIECERNARLVFHTHAHLTVFVEGEPRAVPAGIGIWPPLGPHNFRNGQFGVTAENCITWLSTRYSDGIIHIESSVYRSFELGDLFDVWGQPLSRSQLGPARGDVTAIVNRRVWTGDPNRIPLLKHTRIQLQVGEPLVTPQWIEFPGAF
jgi:hypothetical protein